MLKILKILVIFSAWISSNLALADTSNQVMSKTIKEKLAITLENIRADNSVPAMSIGIIEGGEIFYQKGFGLDASKQIVSGNTQFRVASITKLFTSQAVMQLVEQDKLSLDDKAGKYLADFSGKDISLFELMTHHSGLKDKVRPKKINSSILLKNIFSVQLRSKINLKNHSNMRTLTLMCLALLSQK